MDETTDCTELKKQTDTGFLFIQQEKNYIAQKMKFSIKDFLSKCDQIRSFLWIWSQLLKKSLMKNFIFYAVLLRSDPGFRIAVPWSRSNGFGRWKMLTSLDLKEKPNRNSPAFALKFATFLLQIKPVL